LADRNEHLVVIMVEPAPVGEFEIWTLHITLVPWFPCNDEQRLNDTLNNVTHRHKPLKVSAKEVVQWGKKEKFPVQLIEDNGGLHKLHQDVFDSLENNGFPIHQKDFLGDKYRPHLALRNRYQKSKKLPKGTAIEIKNFSLIKQIRLKKTGTMIKSVVKEYRLNG
jgi:2'-5' RNA ligase